MLKNSTLTFLAIRVFKFNETCCEDNGVPEECMGLCREQVLSRSIQVVYPIDRCVKHKETIQSCMYEETKGK